jgi:hypothetical protein
MEMEDAAARELLHYFSEPVARFSTESRETHVHLREALGSFATNGGLKTPIAAGKLSRDSRIIFHLTLFRFASLDFSFKIN